MAAPATIYGPRAYEAFREFESAREAAESAARSPPHPNPKETAMCRPVRCKTRGKTTWPGCGQHVANVKASVPAGQWCPGHPAESAQGKLAKLFRLR